MSKLKFKCTKVEWYYELNSKWFGSWKQELAKQKREDRRYDGPAHYLKLAEDTSITDQLPKREGIQFWVRKGKGYYDQYIFMENKWFVTKEPQTGVYEFRMNVKQKIADIVLETPTKILRAPYAKLKAFLEVEKSVRRVVRDTNLHTLKSNRRPAK